MDREIVSIEWKNLSLAQLLFVQAVILPEIESVLLEHVLDLKELERD